MTNSKQQDTKLTNSEQQDTNLTNSRQQETSDSQLEEGNIPLVELSIGKDIVVDFLIKQIFGTGSYCHHEIQDGDSEDDRISLNRDFQKLILAPRSQMMRIFRSHQILSEPKEISVERLKRIYEGVFEVTEDSETGTQKNPINIDGSDSSSNELTTKSNSIEPIYSVQKLSKLHKKEIENSLVSLDIDSFLAIPSSLGFAKLGIKVC